VIGLDAGVYVVGLEAAEEITSRGICLEEYLGVIDEIR